jgi:hypothetical protein
MNAVTLTGTPSQIEWAELIRPRVEADFQRVAAAFAAVAARQSDPERATTLALIAIVEEKRVEVMANAAAGYFIRDWQELGGQVRTLLAADSRFQSLQAARRKVLHAI